MGVAARGDVGRFMDKRIHVFRETTEHGARSYCGLSERAEIWRRADDAPLCAMCARSSEREARGGPRGSAMTGAVVLDAPERVR